MATDELLAVELFIGGGEAEVLVDGERDMTTATSSRTGCSPAPPTPASRP